jgi:ribonuclease BN (tRNA processing enzyme)
MESILEEGDRRHAEYMQGADVVIHEAQYTPQEYPSKRHWGHSTYVYVVELAAVAGVRRLFLTHHDPSHDDEFVAGVERKAQELARQLGSPLEVWCAYEGCEIAL